jgi:gas vesicle protein GvpL/GvpF
VEPQGVWIYAITGRVSGVSLGQLRGVGGGPVRAIAAGELTAVVEDVGLAEFGEQALRRNLEDLAWLSATARAHHHVIGALAQLGPLVPIRLATVYGSDGGVAAMLADRDADFRAVLSRIRGRQEWGVKAQAVGRPEPQDASAGAEAPASQEAGAGAAYLQRRRGQLTAHKDARRQMLADAETIHAALSEQAAGARLHPPQAPQLTGTKALMVLNAAYLVDEERGAEFGSVVAALAERYPGVKLELTGPWPPYSFAANEESEGVSERALRIGARDAV